MKHFDLFSGYGGFSLALQRVYGISNEMEQRRCGQEENELEASVSMPVSQSNKRQQATTIGFSEIDKYASAVLKYHWPNTKNYGDITKINWSEVPDFDLLTGGSPCQDLSIAGKRKGLEGYRSGLFYEFLRAIEEKYPRYFIWENVKGALSSQGGWDFTTVLNAFSKAGYSLWWQVLNAKDFGVPQNRERIFVVGFRDECPREIFFERESSGFNNGEDAQGNETAYCLNAGGDKHRGSYIKQLNNPTHSNNRLYSEEGISPALNTAQGGNRQPKIPTNSHIRRLTPTECERLMGLPDGWTKCGLMPCPKNCPHPQTPGCGHKTEISDSQRYKLCGNGVVVNVVEEIIKQLIL